MAARAVRQLRPFLRRSLYTSENNKNVQPASERADCGQKERCITPAVGPDDPQVRKLLDSLGVPDIRKVLKTKVEPLRLPYYKVLSLAELEKVQKEATDKARALLKTPPILPLREPQGCVLEVDEGLAGATEHKIIFTETTQHIDNKLRRIVVREPDGILREATWEERDRMYEVFIPVYGRRMWLPKVLKKENLPPVLDKLLHADVLELVEVQCDPQSHDYHRVHKHVYEDIISRGCYDILYSTRYFGCLVWYLLTSQHPPRLQSLLRDMLKHKLISNASEVIKLYVMCYPRDKTSKLLSTEVESGEELVKHYCEVAGMKDMLPELKETTSLQVAVS